MSNDKDIHQHANSFVTIESTARIAGMDVAEFQTPAEPSISNIQALVPVSVDLSCLMIENCNVRNNYFTVNGVVITIPIGHYGSGGAIAAAIQLALEIEFGPGSFTVSDVSTISPFIRMQISGAAPYTIDSVTPYFTRWTGITAQLVPISINIFNFSKGLPTNYIDVCAHDIHRGIADNTASKSSTGILFRITFDPQQPFLVIASIISQGDKKKIFYPQRTAWPRTVWRLVDEWGLNMICAPGSEYWIIMKTDYYQPQLA